MVNTDRGMKVKYTPEEPGVYYVHTYIGGVEIPGGCEQISSIAHVWLIFVNIVGR